MKENKLHYFALVFTSFAYGVHSQSSVYIGYVENQITLKNIASAKKQAGMPDDCVLLSINYLGHMTPQHFQGTEE